jgi:hypothetical protein
MKEYAVRKSKEQAAKFTPEQLLAYYTSVYEAIAAVKRGELTPSAAVQSVSARVML